MVRFLTGSYPVCILGPPVALGTQVEPPRATVILLPSYTRREHGIGTRVCPEAAGMYTSVGTVLNRDLGPSLKSKSDVMLCLDVA